MATKLPFRMPHLRFPPIMRLLASMLVIASCGDSAVAEFAWSGTMDTLSTGQIVVTNPSQGIWGDSNGWRMLEEVRIGRLDGSGPDVFGRIRDLMVDDEGRVWVLDSQAKQIRVFDVGGRHVWSAGGPGSGPGEFQQPMRSDVSPNGDVWVVDPGNQRVTVLDTAGNLEGVKRIQGGFLTFPWRGGFDTAGSYYAPAPVVGSPRRFVLVRYDANLGPLDTLSTPTDPIQREAFELRGERGGLIAGVPFQGQLTWQLSRNGTIWALLTDQYRLFEIAPTGDTLRSISRAFEPLPVTAADRDLAREELEWFTRQGGSVDWSRIPDVKPLVRGFFIDDEQHVWVQRADNTEADESRFDIFDPYGRYLGPLSVPFPVADFPIPVVRSNRLYAVTENDLDVPVVAVARIVKP